MSTRLSRILYIIWLLICAVLYFFENNTGTRALIIFSLALPMFCAALMLLFRKGISVSVEAPEEAESGAPLSVKMNASWPRLAMRAGFCLNVCNAFTGEGISERFSEQELGSFDLELRGMHCGLLTIEASLTPVDLLGLFSLRPVKSEEVRVLVRPPLFSPEVRLIEEGGSGDSDRYSQSRPGSDPGEVFGVRGYVPGDPVRQIHWKLSQKTDTLMIREFGMPVSEQVSLVFDAGQPADAGTLETLAVILFSVSRSLVLSGCACSVSWLRAGEPSPRCRTVETEEDLRLAQDELLSAPSTEMLSADTFNSMPGSTHVLAVCASAHETAFSPASGRRFTVISPKAQNAMPGAHAVLLNAETYKDDLRVIEI